MRFYLHTYGCQMNRRDSEAVAALLTRHGCVPCAREEEAALVIVNSCSVRGKAEDKALGRLGLLVAARRERPGLVVGLIGCMAQRLGAEVFERVRGLDFAVGPGCLDLLPAVLARVRVGRGPVLETGRHDGREAEALAGHAEGAACALVNILLGCDRRCAYCIVPAVRGAEWSRPAAAVLDEIAALARAGAREVTLLGQSVTRYGIRNAAWDPDSASPGGYTEALPRLLEAAARVPGIARLRFTSAHPEGCTEELARAFRAIPAVCEHLHLPLQSGSDRVLGRMGRGYTVEEYRAAAARLRAAAPGMGLTTDVIVGFPGETAEDFAATRAFMEEMRFDNSFVFKYSPRAGTRAAEWPDDVPDEEKRERNRLLLEDQDRRGQRLYDLLAGSAVEVLAEGPSPRNPERWTGRTRTNKIALFAPGAGLASGDLVRVRIERARPQTLYGSVET
jgi:tRNA-2-methylthio-N6-dimethylallyladenosine synthase